MKTLRTMAGVLALAGVGLLGIAVGGCASEPKPPVTANDHTITGSSVATPAQQKQAVAQATGDNQGGGLQISPEIMKLCPGIKPPKFGFDSAELQADWASALHTLADCMNSGGLVGKGVLLTGHTDPRGEEDYNVGLGGRRAESVKKALGTFGVDSPRVDVTSRGKADATGTDDATWAHDRRVDIDLKPGGKAGSGVSSR